MNELKSYKQLLLEIEAALSEVDNLKRQIKIKNEYLDLIWAIGNDYDGRNTIEGLKELIDELVDMAKKAYCDDDKTVMFTSSNNSKFNILRERLGDKDGNK